MDNPGSNDPIAPKSVFGSNWIRKKSRYEDEDLSLTPPDDSSFFSLRFGAQRSKPNESMYDRINKELGLSVESSKSNVTPELNIAPASKGGDGPPAQLLLGPSGIILETNRRQQSTSSVSVVSAANESPRIIVPATILERKEEGSATSIGGPDSPENSLVAQQDVETLVRKVRGGRPTRKISMNLAETIDRKFLESVQELKVEAPQTVEQAKPLCPVLPNIPDASTIIDTIPVVSAIRDRRRKTSAPPSLNPMKASNFFFTGGLFSTVATTSASTMTSSEAPASLGQQQQQGPSLSLSEMKPSALSEPTSPLKQLDIQGSTDANYALAQNTSLMEERASEAAALEPKGKMGKRRPKASTLREMNFWAPQSM